MSNFVHVVCAYPLVREGLALLIVAEGFKLIQAVGSVAEMALVRDSGGVAIVVDLALPEQPAAVRKIATNSQLRPVILSPAFDLDTMTACLREGAAGYLISNIKLHALVEALHLMFNGQKVLPRNLADELSSRGDRPGQHSAPSAVAREPMKELSQRERDVLCCLLRREPNKLIARQLDVSEATIKANVKGILRKLNVVNRTQAAMWARQHGALDA